MGDAGSANDPRGQNPRQPLAHRRPHGRAPAVRHIARDNAFLSRNGYRAETDVHALPNPWRFSFDAARGRLYLGQDAALELCPTDRTVAGFST